GKNNYLAAVYLEKQGCGLSLLDISTGEFYLTEGTWAQITKLIHTFSPSEILVSNLQFKTWTEKMGSSFFTTQLEDWVFTKQFAEDLLFKHFNVRSLKGFGVENMVSGQIAAGACLHYLMETKHEKSAQISRIQKLSDATFLSLDASTIRNLELLAPSRFDIDEKCSLFGVLNRSTTPMGARLMRRYISMPLIQKTEIEERLRFVQELMEHPETGRLLQTVFSGIGDMERLLSKVAAMRANPRELYQLKTCLFRLQDLKDSLLEDAETPPSLRAWAEKIALCEPLRTYLNSGLHEDPPVSLAKGMVIAEGFNVELDELRKLVFSGKDYLVEIQQREAQRSHIPNLKLGFTSVFGYYLEVSKSYKDRVPEDWVRKQTLTNGERYVTAELKTYEERVLQAEEKISKVEAAVYEQLLLAVRPFIEELQDDARLVAFADVMYAFADAAKLYGYVRPEITEDTVLEIEEGRHPVIERCLPVGETYIPNDLRMDPARTQILMITGPNMSGKSAVLRQTALIVLMAQMGCFVPAKAARIGLVDKVFMRVGASDNLASGESTFMVEMNETANILNNITSRSLVLLDEIGRGTSTYDGISIAWAIAEFLHEDGRATPKVLFATHYHELNRMAEQFPRIHNYHVSIKEVGKEMLFLRKLVPGGSEHSFGIHVARMAGMPAQVVRRAEELLAAMEKTTPRESIAATLCPGRARKIDSPEVKTPGNVPDERMENASTVCSGPIKSGYQLSFIQLEDPLIEKIKEDILNTDLNNLTPIEALNKLNEIKKLIS
ncbi:MAG: DNA mismatch repair protein MutS, partial [Bacteroidales bacterium]|nr:DNA mismatch repair protein MutS [Bacteroidales bacterium]